MDRLNPLAARIQAAPLRAILLASIGVVALLAAAAPAARAASANYAEAQVGRLSVISAEGVKGAERDANDLWRFIQLMKAVSFVEEPLARRGLTCWMLPREDWKRLRMALGSERVNVDGSMPIARFVKTGETTACFAHTQFGEVERNLRARSTKSCRSSAMRSIRDRSKRSSTSNGSPQCWRPPRAQRADARHARPE